MKTSARSSSAWSSRSSRTTDGFGPQAGKLSKYRRFTDDQDGLYEGFKLFYKEDTDLMSPEEVLDLSPEPDVVVFE